MELSLKSLTLWFVLVLLLLQCLYATFFRAEAEEIIEQRALNNAISAIFVFGDSTVDPGNNNYINTVFRSNFPPYGKDFLNQEPTGRFTNGRLTTDFIASYVGLKEYIPPYLDPNLTVQDLLTGVSFASAGSGFDPLTPRMSSTIDMPKQLEYFKEYKRRLESAIGRQRIEDHIRKSGFIISGGTNDFIVNYFSLPIRRNSYTLSAYQQFVVQKAKQFLQGLWEEGARRIAVTGLPPMGCLPAVITLYSDNSITERGCIENYSSAARDYNLMLQSEVNFLKVNRANLGGRFYYIDIYAPLDDMIQGQGKLGFEEVSTGCCGTGYLEASFLCNPKSYVCSDASKYVFWDSIHPTETTYSNLFNACRSIIDDFIKCKV